MFAQLIQYSYQNLVIANVQAITTEHLDIHHAQSVELGLRVIKDNLYVTYVFQATLELLELLHVFRASIHRLRFRPAHHVHVQLIRHLIQRLAIVNVILIIIALTAMLHVVSALIHQRA